MRPPSATSWASRSIGVPVDLIERAHEAGILWIQQVMDRTQAEEAVAARADVIIGERVMPQPLDER